LVIDRKVDLFQNGVCESRPLSQTEQHAGGVACSRVEVENGVGGGGELSPSALRRSTRACALKAAERIKLKESLTPIIDGLASHSGEGYVSGDDDLEEGKRPAKKRRLASGFVLDQSNCKFGIRLEGDEVLLMSDESEVSSLNDVEVEHLKKTYEKIIHRDMSEEQKRERELLIKTMEADLRLEEAKLTMLKKLRLSQHVSVRQLQDANVRKMTANVAQNGSGNAYKPPVATPPARSAVAHSSHAKGKWLYRRSRLGDFALLFGVKYAWAALGSWKKF
uniref:P66_CC domain-containing protein n=1 Tax=Toxocara canis TaxID=6265 RepID=A0A183U111_TOXCA